MSLSTNLSDRSDAGGLESFQIEEMGKLGRHLLPFLWMKKSCEDVSSFHSGLREVMVTKHKLVHNAFFNTFLVQVGDNLKRSWNDYTNSQLKLIYQMFDNKNPRVVGGALDEIDIYHSTVPLIGPMGIGGANDGKFHNIFSMQKLNKL